MVERIVSRFVQFNLELLDKWSGEASATLPSTRQPLLPRPARTPPSRKAPPLTTPLRPRPRPTHLQSGPRPCPPTFPSRPHLSGYPSHLGSDHAPLELAKRLAVVGFPGWPQPHSSLLGGALPTLLHLQLGERVQGVLQESGGSGGPPWTHPPQTHPPPRFSDSEWSGAWVSPRKPIRKDTSVSVSSKDGRNLGQAGDPYHVFCGSAQAFPRQLTSHPSF